MHNKLTQKIIHRLDRREEPETCQTNLESEKNLVRGNTEIPERLLQDFHRTLRIPGVYEGCISQDKCLTEYQEMRRGKVRPWSSDKDTPCSGLTNAGH